MLSKNQLTSLPKELADLPNLQVIKVRGNRLPERLIQSAEAGIDEFRRVVMEVMKSAATGTVLLTQENS